MNLRASSALGPGFVVALSALSFTTACGGPPKAESAHGKRLPADGAPVAVAVDALPGKTISQKDYSRALEERLAPACDTRGGARTADATNLEGAGKILDTWTDFKSKKGKSPTGSGKAIGKAVEPTRSIASIGMTCAAGGSALQVNGVRYPFDLAWVVAREGTGPTLSGNEGAGYFTMIQAISFKDQRVIFAKVYVPSDANDDTDDTVIVSSLAGVLPDNADEPIVRAVSERSNPKFETFIVAKGANDGISLQVPQQDAFGRARYLSVARFILAP